MSLIITAIMKFVWWVNGEFPGLQFTGTAAVVCPAVHQNSLYEKCRFIFEHSWTILVL